MPTNTPGPEQKVIIGGTFFKSFHYTTAWDDALTLRLHIYD